MVRVDMEGLTDKIKYLQKVWKIEKFDVCDSMRTEPIRRTRLNEASVTESGKALRARGASSARSTQVAASEACLPPQFDPTSVDFSVRIARHIPQEVQSERRQGVDDAQLRPSQRVGGTAFAVHLTRHVLSTQMATGMLDEETAR